MVYMTLTAATGAGGGQGHGPGHAAGAGPPLLTGALLLYFAGYVVLGGTRLITAGGGAAAPSDAGRGGPTELIRACRLAMGMGMLAMLLAM
ncbi:hypothetical protein SAVIM40S_00206 [Streptomyces avidinii]